jgi:hypothetical protein
MPTLLPSVEIDKLPQGNPKVGDFFVFKDMVDGITKKVPAAALLTSSDDQNFAWVSNAHSGVGYAINESVTYGGYWFISLINANLTTPGVDPTKWQQVSKVFGTVRVWQAGLYANAEEYVVGYNPQGFLFMWRLATGIARPFISADFNTEVNNGTWEPFSKGYVDSVNDSLPFKHFAHMASTGNLVLSGIQNIDGVAGADGKIVLAKDQFDLTENGWWSMKAGAWTRCSFANPVSLMEGAVGMVVGGTVNKEIIFKQVTYPVNPGSNVVFKKVVQELYDLTSPTTITVGNLMAGSNITGLTQNRILELILTGSIRLFASEFASEFE